MTKSGSKTSKPTYTTHYDGGGGNKVDVPENAPTRTRPDGGHDALVETGGDGGGKTTEWVKID